jgi:hypothetical protein
MITGYWKPSRRLVGIGPQPSDQFPPAAGDTANGDTAKQNAAAITEAKTFMEKPLGHPHGQMLTIARRAVHPIF